MNGAKAVHSAAGAGPDGMDYTWPSILARMFHEIRTLLPVSCAIIALQFMKHAG
ncbi:MAG: hypothetical protein WC995_13515 [Lysobacteraceae bacterium]